MSFNYAAVGKTVTGLMKTFGTTMIIRSRREDVDPVTGLSVPTIADSFITGVISMAKNAPDNPNHKQGDKEVLTSGEAVENIDPTRDRLIYGNEIYKIVSADPVSPAGTTVLWTMRVRRGE